MEEWRAVPGYVGRYEVSDLGQTRSLICNKGKRKNPKILLPHENAKTGYLQLSLSRNGKVHCVLVHQLVASAFIGPCPEGMEVNHINGVKADCRRNNLEYKTHQENIEHAQSVLGWIGGRANGSGVKKDEEAWETVGEMMFNGYSRSEIANETGYSVHTVNKICALHKKGLG